MALNLTGTPGRPGPGASAVSAAAARLLGLQLDLLAARAIAAALSELQRDDHAETRARLHELERGLNDFPTKRRGLWHAIDGADALRDLDDSETLTLTPSEAASLARVQALEVAAGVIAARKADAAATAASLQPLVKACEAYVESLANADPVTNTTTDEGADAP